MSGVNGMNEWEQHFKPGRDHIKRITGLSDAARVKTNRELSSSLYEIAMELPDPQSIDIIEAAERLVATELTETEHLGHN